jgi:hypothetical protein
MDDRDGPWAFGDRLAWEGIEPEGDDETLAVIERLQKHLAPVSGRPLRERQLVERPDESGGDQQAA